MEFEKRDWPNLQNKVLSAILIDDLKEAKRLLQGNDEALSGISELLEKTTGKPTPLKNLTAQPPREIHTAVSYTCGIGCKMCGSGFHDKTSLFEDYKQLSPQQFDEVMPWIDAAELVVYVGQGETLDNPHIYDFVKKSAGKHSNLTTSGVPLTREKMKRLIQASLKDINFSFDGLTLAGHGSGNIKYSQTIWKQIDMVQSVKKELGSEFPQVMITMVLNKENVDQMEEMIDSAKERGVFLLQLDVMVPHNPELYEQSIFTDFKYYQKKINEEIKKGNEKGLWVRIGDDIEIKDSQPCHFIDKMLIFNLDRYLPSVCCGPITMPLKIQGYSTDTYWNSFPFRYFRFMHGTGKSETLPVACDTCWAMNPLKFADQMQPKDNDFKARPLYLEASELKNQNKWDEAEKNYKTIIQNSDNPVWRGKAYFHLAEREILEKNYPKAYTLFQETVKNYFGHQLAFTYLYLLMMLLEKKQEDSFSLERMQCSSAVSGS
ncbi:MAG: radical SAM protein [Nitrospinaceae bacterium]|nr:radical SAM protein [Nitrospina sp.]MBT5377266.1 radical SAM protein [Nitrospinaceae bacterium]